MLLVGRRYGSISDYSRVVQSFGQIAKTTGVSASTVWNVITRYHVNDNGFKKHRRGRTSLIPAHVQQLMCRQETLKAMAFQPLVARARAFAR